MSAKNSQSAQPGVKQRVLVNVILDKSGSMSTKVLPYQPKARS
jgi:hypothetical protein